MPQTSPTETPQNNTENIPVIQRIIAVLWPSFIMSGIATGLFFTAFDPLELVSLSGHLEVSRMGAYSIGFFLFWLLTAMSCAFTCYFQRPCHPDRSPPKSQ